MGEELKGKISLDATQFASGINKAKSLAKEFGVSAEKNLGISAFKGMVAGALSVGAVTNGITSLLEKADGIDALAKRFDLTAEAVQAIQFAADQSGASAESMFVALKKINVAQQEAIGGNAEMVQSFAGLGVTIEDLKSKSFEQIFYQIGQNVNGASLESVKMGDAIKVMGRSGDQVLGAMRDGFTDVAKSASVMTASVVKDLANANDAIAAFNHNLQNIAGGALGYFMTVASNLGAFTAALEAVLFKGAKAEDIAKMVGTGAAESKPKKASSIAVGGGGTVEIKKPEPGPISIPSMNLTSNQQIGAYSSQNPFLNRQLAIEQAMLDLQRKVAKSTEDTARNTAEVARKTPTGSDYE